MCPACMTTAVVMAASATSAGGLVALAVKKLHVLKRVIGPKEKK